MEDNPVFVREWHPLYNYIHCCSLQLSGFYVHVDGLENLFLCLKFTINVFNTYLSIVKVKKKEKRKKSLHWLFVPRMGITFFIKCTSDSRD